MLPLCLLSLLSVTIAMKKYMDLGLSKKGKSRAKKKSGLKEGSVMVSINFVFNT